VVEHLQVWGPNSNTSTTIKKKKKKKRGEPERSKALVIGKSPNLKEDIKS
jgi:hypothetical protein